LVPGVILLLHDGLGRPRTGDRIGVTMDDLPLAAFTSKDGRHAKRHRHDLLDAADLSSPPLELDDVRQVRRRILRDALEADRLALSELGNRALQGRLDPIPTTGRRKKGVGEGDVVAPRNICFFGSGSPFTSASSAR